MLIQWCLHRHISLFVSYYYIKFLRICKVIWNTKLKNAKEYDIIVTGSITIVIFGKDR